MIADTPAAISHTMIPAGITASPCTAFAAPRNSGCISLNRQTLIRNPAKEDSEYTSCTGKLQQKKESLLTQEFPSIGVARLELAASTSLTWRASQLRYTPAIYSCALKLCKANYLKRKSYYTESIR